MAQNAEYFAEGLTGPKPRVFIVSNRAKRAVVRTDQYAAWLKMPAHERRPLTFAQSKMFKATEPDGGLASALQGVEASLKRQYNFIYVGYPGLEPQNEEEAESITALLGKFHIVPVFINQEEYRGYYDGFANSVMWPALHSLPEFIKYEPQYLTHYHSVNGKFAEACTKEGPRAEDIIWVMDYHLMLLCSTLRTSKVKSRIGFFLHTPFPSLEQLDIDFEGREPVMSHISDNLWKELLSGVLGADLIGFHIPEYTTNFVNSVQEYLKLDFDHDDSRSEEWGKVVGYKILKNGSSQQHTARCTTIPVGIDPKDWEAKAAMHDIAQTEVSRIFKEWHQKQHGVYKRKILFGLDRFDYTKGFELKMKGFAQFLRDDKDKKWREKVVLIQVAVPSRGSTDKYKEYQTRARKVIAEINEEFATLTWTPIEFLHQKVDPVDLALMYSLSDVALVTPIRDGLNLVSMEYVVRQQANHGVLILSGNPGAGAGAATYLEKALIFNPKRLDAVKTLSKLIDRALLMGPEERAADEIFNMKQVERYTAAEWGERFVKRLRDLSLDWTWSLSLFPKVKCLRRFASLGSRDTLRNEYFPEARRSFI